MKRETLFTRLEQSMLVIGKEMHEHVMELGDIACSPAQKFVLMNVSSYGPMSVKQLAERLRVTSGAATQHVDALEKQELVTRRINANDRREIVIEVTEKGGAFVQKIREQQSRMLNNLFEGLDDAELCTLVELMEKVSEHHKTNGESKI